MPGSHVPQLGRLRRLQPFIKRLLEPAQIVA
jgi:hypothetical protein